ncbi:response regulator receiver modulated GAF sensor protein [Thalassoporum mexicanum PCC 7367]|uniref:response regulator n=1 Tax=Thalassoporum mexicanum TaxID=3457544 RepID=UPI00029FB170|nr:response regulator [Pseudanabaena sp. PCC 7367]AFY71345.1 response regulator receiver modulated GAF sensor protein [Pseudanabaena sp. PCC 7367]
MSDSNSSADIHYFTASGSARPKKPKLLVVDDEQDNLDLLYRTFRRDFQVFRAESGVQALEVLKQEGEVAVIISDQRMPEMKGTEFLSKTVPEFPDTVRIVLTGFTDVEDLVEAINSGQVYKYITKPWDPEELKQVVQRATNTYQLMKSRSDELRRARSLQSYLTALYQISPRSQDVAASFQPIADAFGQSYEADGCVLQLIEAGQLKPEARATTGTVASDPNWLGTTPLAQQAIAEQRSQIAVNLASDEALANHAAYQDGSVNTHLVFKIVYGQDLLALVSMQWQQNPSLSSEDIEVMQRCADQTAIALTCIRCYQPL